MNTTTTTEPELTMNEVLATVVRMRVQASDMFNEYCGARPERFDYGRRERGEAVWDQECKPWFEVGLAFEQLGQALLELEIHIARMPEDVLDTPPAPLALA